MAYGYDWYPGSRDGQLHMVKTWNTVFVTNARGLHIPQDHLTQLGNDAQAAEAMVDKVKSGERTPADVVQCSLVFQNMETGARFVEKHYLLMPPLTPTDFASLLLPLPDETYTRWAMLSDCCAKQLHCVVCGSAWLRRAGSQNWCGRIRTGVSAHKTCERERPYIQS
jgi:hypothetical protein